MGELEKIVETLRRAAATGINNGRWRDSAAYAASCTARAQLEPDRAARIMYMRDAAPGFPISLHLSMSFVRSPIADALPFDHAVGRQVAQLFFRPHEHLLIVHPTEARWGPSVDDGRLPDQEQFIEIWHYHLFMVPDWTRPLESSPAHVPDNAMRWSDYQFGL